eukprot:TRINITY_DN15367_c0_g1_i1.p1 TRINITY_DN15367_c0_g1~~TRINITY_DN15367_c0_g1_i1.p1  ORF type:complete len:105 (-),score=19.17 TRINITY_DN15367_c0_g1_i1:43-357(-)
MLSVEMLIHWDFATTKASCRLLLLHCRTNEVGSEDVVFFVRLSLRTMRFLTLRTVWITVQSNNSSVVAVFAVIYSQTAINGQLSKQQQNHQPQQQQQQRQQQQQ